MGSKPAFRLTRRIPPDLFLPSLSIAALLLLNRLSIRTKNSTIPRTRTRWIANPTRIRSESTRLVESPFLTDSFFPFFPSFLDLRTPSRSRYRTHHPFLLHDDDEPPSSSRDAISDDHRSSEETIGQRPARNLGTTVTAEETEISVEVEEHVTCSFLVCRRIRNYLEPSSSLLGSLLRLSLFLKARTPPPSHSPPPSNRILGYLVLFIVARYWNLVVGSDWSSRTSLLPHSRSHSLALLLLPRSAGGVELIQNPRYLLSTSLLPASRILKSS